MDGKNLGRYWSREQGSGSGSVTYFYMTLTAALTFLEPSFSSSVGCQALVRQRLIPGWIWGRGAPSCVLMVFWSLWSSPPFLLYRTDDPEMDVLTLPCRAAFPASDPDTLSNVSSPPSTSHCHTLSPLNLPIPVFLTQCGTHKKSLESHAQ